MLCTCLSLGTSKNSSSSVLNVHKGITTHEFVLSFPFLNFLYLVLLFFFLIEELGRILASICTPFHFLRIFLPIPKESSKISRITWSVHNSLKANLSSYFPLSPNNPCNFKETIINYGNRHMFFLQHII